MFLTGCLQFLVEGLHLFCRLFAVVFVFSSFQQQTRICVVWLFYPVLVSGISWTESILHLYLMLCVGHMYRLCIDTVLIEAAMPTTLEMIRSRTSKFSKKELLGIHWDETPLRRIFKICEQKQTKGYRFIKNLITPTDDPQPSSLLQKFENETGSKAVTYKRINPQLKLHSAYTSTKYVNERERLEFTKFRLSSHHLKIGGRGLTLKIVCVIVEYLVKTFAISTLRRAQIHIFPHISSFNSLKGN